MELRPHHEMHPMVCRQTGQSFAMATPRDGACALPAADRVCADRAIGADRHEDFAEFVEHFCSNSDTPAGKCFACRPAARPSFHRARIAAISSRSDRSVFDFVIASKLPTTPEKTRCLFAAKYWQFRLSFESARALKVQAWRSRATGTLHWRSRVASSWRPVRCTLSS